MESLNNQDNTTASSSVSQGDTSKAGTKPATVETGFTLQVPLFVNNGERIRIDTRTGTYMSRA